MKVLHVTFSDNYGGANIAAYRIHKSLENKIISKILVLDKKLKNEKNVIKIKNTNKLIFKLKNYTARIINLLFISKYNNSFNIFDSNLVDAINKSNFDIIHLHWINNEIISIKDIKTGYLINEDFSGNIHFNISFFCSLWKPTENQIITCSIKNISGKIIALATNGPINVYIPLDSKKFNTSPSDLKTV